jgi:hypothetical protein
VVLQPIELAVATDSGPHSLIAQLAPPKAPVISVALMLVRSYMPPPHVYEMIEVPGVVEKPLAACGHTTLVCTRAV